MCEFYLLLELTKQLLEPKRGVEPRSSGYKAGALPPELFRRGMFVWKLTTPVVRVQVQMDNGEQL
jgi:hypothetical protein